LTVTGEVEKFVTITPSRRVRLSGRAGQPIEETVTIIPGEKYPFKIIKAKATNGKRIYYYLSESMTPNGRQYVLTVKNIKTGKGRYLDTIVLKTTSKYRPEITIQVYGNII
jgi:hypothetical protein